MNKVSSSPFFHKKVFPILWFGFLAFFALTIFTPLPKEINLDDMMLYAAPFLMAAFGYFLLKKIVFDLIDEVYEEGETLIFKNKGKTVRVDFREVREVKYKAHMNPPKVTISLRRETELGSQLSFRPLKNSAFLKKENPEVLDLIDRIDKAKRRS